MQGGTLRNLRAHCSRNDERRRSTRYGGSPRFTSAASGTYTFQPRIDSQGWAPLFPKAYNRDGTPRSFLCHRIAIHASDPGDARAKVVPQTTRRPESHIQSSIAVAPGLWPFHALTMQDPGMAASLRGTVNANDSVNTSMRNQVLAYEGHSTYIHTLEGSLEQLVFDPQGAICWPNSDIRGFRVRNRTSRLRILSFKRVSRYPAGEPPSLWREMPVAENVPAFGEPGSAPPWKLPPFRFFENPNILDPLETNPPVTPLSAVRPLFRYPIEPYPRVTLICDTLQAPAGCSQLPEHTRMHPQLLRTDTLAAPVRVLLTLPDGCGPRFPWWRSQGRSTDSLTTPIVTGFGGVLGCRYSSNSSMKKARYLLPSARRTPACTLTTKRSFAERQRVSRREK